MGTANDKFYDATHDNLDGDTHQGTRLQWLKYFVSVHPMQKQQKLDIRLPPDAYAETHNMPLYLKYSVKNALSFSNGMMSI